MYGNTLHLPQYGAESRAQSTSEVQDEAAGTRNADNPKRRADWMDGSFSPRRRSPFSLESERDPAVPSEEMCDGQ
jgi:hypothetical protein